MVHRQHCMEGQARGAARHSSAIVRERLFHAITVTGKGLTAPIQRFETELATHGVTRTQSSVMSQVTKAEPKHV